MIIPNNGKYCPSSVYVIIYIYIKDMKPVLKAENTAVGIRHADHVEPSIRKC
jgi:hypothetical protein